jgi:hypothetical protein
VPTTRWLSRRPFLAGRFQRRHVAVECGYTPASAVVDRRPGPPERRLAELCRRCPSATRASTTMERYARVWCNRLANADCAVARRLRARARPSRRTSWSISAARAPIRRWRATARRRVRLVGRGRRRGGADRPRLGEMGIDVAGVVSVPGVTTGTALIVVDAEGAIWCGAWRNPPRREGARRTRRRSDGPVLARRSRRRPVVGGVERARSLGAIAQPGSPPRRCLTDPRPCRLPQSERHEARCPAPRSPIPSRHARRRCVSWAGVPGRSW